MNYHEIRLESIFGSEGFWLKMGFKECPKDSNSYQDYTHYMTIL